LEALERMLAAEELELCEALSSDLGKPAPEAWLTEVSFVIQASQFARKNLDRWTRSRPVNTPVFAMPGRSRVRPEPLGTVLIIAPWNYPLQLCLAPLVTAISAGNCAVIKPSELAPATASALARLLPRYLDPECVVVIEGGVDASTQLLDEPWGHIVFTGGSRVAKIVMSAAARHLSPVTLELGGKSPCVVLPDANLEVAARRIAWGRFTNAGQTCIAPDYVLTDAHTRDRLVPLLRNEIEQMFGEDPSRSPDYGRIINETHFDRLLGLMEGAQCVVGGDSRRESLYIAPTVISPAAADQACMQDEIFGPLLPILDSPDLDTAIAHIRSKPKPLSAYLFSKDRKAQARFEDEVSAGSICLNDVMLFMAIEDLPFGGVGNSGMGNYKGEGGFHNLSHDKAVLSRSLWPDWALRYAPISSAKMKWLRRLR
ncbi:MAG: aldehyde dehydrogenase family protein, partial [Xanthomonadales bacterium]|nr:aldehyde dehydrogenase family protein [Xanthomonadales bacterium]